MPLLSLVTSISTAINDGIVLIIVLQSTNVNSSIYEKKRTEGQAAEGDCEHPVAIVN